MQMVPYWFAVVVMLRYRALRNYQSLTYLWPRVGDTTVFSLIIMSVRFCQLPRYLTAVRGHCALGTARSVTTMKGCFEQLSSIVSLCCQQRRFLYPELRFSSLHECQYTASENWLYIWKIE